MDNEILELYEQVKDKLTIEEFQAKINDISKEYSNTNVNPTHKTNVDILVKHKIISSPEIWYSLTDLTPDHIKALINKTISKLGKTSNDHKTNVNTMVELGIINSPEIWYTPEKLKLEHIKALINKIAKKIEG